MIIDLKATSTSAIAQTIDELHKRRGECATGRVLTLLISTDAKEMESALKAANNASREHPCRVIAIENTPLEQDGHLDAQIRFGADAGAGEVIILRPHNDLLRHADTLVIPLLVPDAPIVAWWPTNPPENPSQDLLGAMASSRITDAQRSNDMAQTVAHLQEHWSPHNVDLSWTRLTPWRALLAAMLDQPPHLPVVQASVSGAGKYLPLQLLAAWLHTSLRVDVQINEEPTARAITGVTLTRADGMLSLTRPDGGDQAMISLPGQAAQPIALPVRTLEDCLSEELGRIDPDEIYADVIRQPSLLADLQ